MSEKLPGPSRLQVIDGTDKPKRARAGDQRPPDLIQCHRCGGREIVATLTGATLKAGKVSGGTKQWLCVQCLKTGQRVVLA